MAQRYPNFRRAPRGRAGQGPAPRNRRDRRVVALVATSAAAAALMAWSIAPLPTPGPRTDQPRRERPSTPVYFPNCNAARAAGAAPIHVGEPAYRPALDRDGDGIACEPYRGR